MSGLNGSQRAELEVLRADVAAQRRQLQIAARCVHDADLRTQILTKIVATLLHREGWAGASLSPSDLEAARKATGFCVAIKPGEDGSLTLAFVNPPPTEEKRDDDPEPGSKLIVP